MLTETEIKKLMSPDRDKANDFIVRKKFKKWLDDLYVVFVIILRYLPEKQTKKLIEHKHTIYMMDILLHLLSILTVPIIQNGKEYTAVDRYKAPRPATPEEISLRFDTKTMVHALFRHLSNEDVLDVMQAELDRNQPEYMIMKRIK
jgi:hypothetical protein